MCGILLRLCKSIPPPLHKSFENAIRQRGPDAYEYLRIKISPILIVDFHASVLALRGPSVQTQPIQSSSGNVLMFNGQIFGGEPRISLSENDTKNLFRRLDNCQSLEQVLQTISSIKGPFSIVFYHACSQSIIFGRDRIGRRSLVWNIDDASEELIISSIGSGEDNISEVSADGIFVLDLTLEGVPKECVRLYPWSSRTKCNFAFELPVITGINSDLSNIPGQHIKSQSLIEQTYEKLSRAVQLRIENIPKVKDGARLAILFSGGLDCMILAALSHIYVPFDEPIDLINVAFENPRSIAGAIRESKKNRESIKPIDPYDVPDRKTAEMGFFELQTVYPTRKWRLVRVNVAYEQTLRSKETVLRLLHPSFSVMDYSIALAFYHATHSLGTLDCSAPYCSSAKVVFSGLGADEQFGGYSRHLKAWNQGSWNALVQEMQLDLDRISMRNLGRDDRIISDAGREVRFPYLDEDFVEWASSLRIWEKVDLRLPTGDKVLLREMLAWMGFQRGAAEKKRAIQFGAKSAKMEGQEDGKDRLKFQKDSI